MEESIASDLSEWLQDIWFNMGMGIIIMQIFCIIIGDSYCSRLPLSCFIPGTPSSLASAGNHLLPN